MRKIMRKQAWLILLAAGTVLPALAQTTVVPPAADPGAVRQRQIDDDSRRRDAERLQQPITEPLKRDGIAPPQTAGDATAAADAVRFQVTRIEFTPSEILTAAELEDIAKDFRGRALTLAELQQLVARVNALYRSKNVVTAQALVPPQDVSQGVVRVRLVEGRVGKVELQGNTSTESDFITNRLGLRTGDLVDLERLEPALRRFNRSNDVQLRAELKPGTGFGLTDLQVGVVEPQRQEIRLMLDNLGGESTGAWRLSTTYINRSLLGLRDELNATATDADGLRGLSLAYAFPVNRWGGRLNLGWSRDDTAVRHGPLVPLNITGASSGYSALLRQPMVVEQRAQVDLLLGSRKRYSENFIDSVFLQRTDTRDRSLGLEAQYFGTRSRWLASYTRYFGEVQLLAPVSLQIDRGSVRFDQEFGAGMSLRGTLGWQSAQQRNLPSSEQYFIGGDGSVRGYPTSALSGDVGHTLNLELHHPIGRVTLGTSELAASGFFFFDRGDVTPFRPPNSSLPARLHLMGAGWGVVAALDKRVSARLTFGYGLNKLDFEPSRYQIHFQLIASIL